MNELSIPDHIKIKESDTDKIKSQKQKKIKALKQNHKIQVQTSAAAEKQNSWLNFNSKGIKKSKGHFGGKNESIFKSNEHGKIGV